MYRVQAGGTAYAFSTLKELLAKATPPRSGDVLAGVAATSAEENVAAKMALADVPLKQFLTEALVPYESRRRDAPHHRHATMPRPSRPCRT